MGKEVLSANIDEKAKDAIAIAAIAVQRDDSNKKRDGSMTAFIEQIGQSVSRDIDKIKLKHGNDLPKCKLIVKLIPVSDQ